MKLHAYSRTGAHRFDSERLGRYRCLVCERLRERGIRLAPLLSKAGLSAHEIDNSSVRVEARSQIRILDLAADALQDDLLGFHLAADYDLREVGLFYYVLASADVMNDALQKTARYGRIANEGVSLKLRDSKEFAITFEYTGVERRSSCPSHRILAGLHCSPVPPADQPSITPKPDQGGSSPQEDAGRIPLAVRLRYRIRGRRGRAGFSRCSRAHADRQRQRLSQPAPDQVLRRGPCPPDADAACAPAWKMRWRPCSRTARQTPSKLRAGSE